MTSKCIQMTVGCNVIQQCFCFFQNEIGTRELVLTFCPLLCYTVIPTCKIHMANNTDRLMRPQLARIHSCWEVEGCLGRLSVCLKKTSDVLEWVLPGKLVADVRCFSHPGNACSDKNKLWKKIKLIRKQRKIKERERTKHWKTLPRHLSRAHQPQIQLKLGCPVLREP